MRFPYSRGGLSRAKVEGKVYETLDEKRAAIERDLKTLLPILKLSNVWLVGIGSVIPLLHYLSKYGL